MPRKAKGFVDNQRTNFAFKFNGVLHNVSQEVVYDQCAKDVTMSCMDGYNGTGMIKHCILRMFKLWHTDKQALEKHLQW